MEQMESKHSMIAEYYTECYDELKAFVASRLQGDEVAEQADDIVQNVFVRLLRMDKMITRVTLPCLVYTTARNLLYDYWRHRQHQDLYEHTVRTTNWQSKSSDDVETLYSAREIEEMLEKSIARLPEQQARIYRLNLCEGMQVAEIAQVMNLKYKNAEYNLGMARKSVRGKIKKVLAS